MKLSSPVILLMALTVPAWAGVVLEADFNDGTLATMLEASYGEGEAGVEVVESVGVEGTPCARIENIRGDAKGAVKHDMRYRAGRAYTITAMVRAEKGTAEVTAYLDSGDWRLRYPGGYAPAMQVGEDWQQITWTNVHQQGRSYLANVRNNSRTPILVDNVVIRESEGVFAINHALADNRAEPSADSLYAQYRLEPINDGAQAYVGGDFTRRATATGESDGPHWVQVSFPAQRPISRVVVYWASEGGTVYTSQRFAVQLMVDDAWQTVAEVEEPEPVAFSAAEFPQTQAEAVRILQPADGGPEQRPNLLWVSELEAW